MKSWVTTVLAASLSVGFACSREKQPSAPTSATTQIADTSQPEFDARFRESQETLLTLTALVTDLQVDWATKKARYETLSSDPTAPPQQRDKAKWEFLESQDQLIAMKEKLIEVRNDHRDLEAGVPLRQRRETPSKASPSVPNGTPPTTSSRSQATTPRAKRAAKKLVELHEQEVKLSELTQLNKKRYEDLERARGAKHSAVDKTFKEYLETGGRLSALRERIATLQVQAAGHGERTAVGGTAKEMSDIELEETYLALTALVVELQVDGMGKRAQYEALLNEPKIEEKHKKQARRSYLECVEQEWALKERLAEKRAEMRVLDRKMAERLNREERERSRSR